jgi:hypothetical protein
MADFCDCGILRQTPAPGVHPAPDTGTPNAPNRGHDTPQTGDTVRLPGARPAGASGTPARARNGDTIAAIAGTACYRWRSALRLPCGFYCVPGSCDAGTACT